MHGAGCRPSCGSGAGGGTGGGGGTHSGHRYTPEKNTYLKNPLTAAHALAGRTASSEAGLQAQMHALREEISANDAAIFALKRDLGL